jgi:hypothetical protein
MDNLIKTGVSKKWGPKVHPPGGSHPLRHRIQQPFSVAEFTRTKGGERSGSQEARRHGRIEWKKEKDEKINQALLRNKDVGFRIAPPFSVNQSARRVTHTYESFAFG